MNDCACTCVCENSFDDNVCLNCRIDLCKVGMKKMVIA